MQKEKIKEPDLTRWALFAPPGAWLRITEIPFLSITEGETKKREQGGIGSAPRPIMVQGGEPLPKPPSLRHKSDHTTKEDEGRPRATTNLSAIEQEQPD